MSETGRLSSLGGYRRRQRAIASKLRRAAEGKLGEQFEASSGIGERALAAGIRRMQRHGGGSFAEHSRACFALAILAGGGRLPQRCYRLLTFSCYRFCIQACHTISPQHPVITGGLARSCRHTPCRLRLNGVPFFGSLPSSRRNHWHFRAVALNRAPNNTTGTDFARTFASSPACVLLHLLPTLLGKWTPDAHLQQRWFWAAGAICERTPAIAYVERHMGLYLPSRHGALANHMPGTGTEHNGLPFALATHCPHILPHPLPSFTTPFLADLTLPVPSQVTYYPFLFFLAGCMVMSLCRSFTTSKRRSVTSASSSQQHSVWHLHHVATTGGAATHIRYTYTDLPYSFILVPWISRARVARRASSPSSPRSALSSSAFAIATHIFLSFLNMFMRLTGCAKRLLLFRYRGCSIRVAYARKDATRCAATLVQLILSRSRFWLRYLRPHTPSHLHGLATTHRTTHGVHRAVVNMPRFRSYPIRLYTGRFRRRGRNLLLHDSPAAHSFVGADTNAF